MRILGIIAEYNPLHTGHVYHLQKALELSGASATIVVLSGNFVQRGEPACVDKFTRAEWAVRAGADLVLELPSAYALSSAERFALGGVRLLQATGIVTDIAFGCEEGDVSTLTELGALLTEEPAEYREALHRHLKLGKSYPRARYDALAQIGTEERLLQALTKPNNILAIEYLRAIGMYAPQITAHPITREGSGYLEEKLQGSFASATAIRAALETGNSEVLRYMPSFVGGAMLYDESLPLRKEPVNAMAMVAMRKMSTDQLAEIPDVAEGFENVIHKAVRVHTDMNAMLAEIKTKRFTMARLKRIAMCSLLGIDNSLVHDIIRSDASEYAKVLAMSQKGRGLLSQISSRSRLPILMRNADVLSQNAVIRRSLSVDALSTDILAIASGRDTHRDNEGPVIVS